MRTTLRIADDLLDELKRLALAQNVPMTKIVDRVIRQGLAAKPLERPVYREKVFSMGVPLIDITKAMSIAADEEDAEIIRKMAFGK